jgi:hypothetical protein
MSERRRPKLDALVQLTRLLISAVEPITRLIDAIKGIR